MIDGYLDQEGRVHTWPSRKRRAAQLAILRYLGSKLERGRSYREVEVNEILLEWHTFRDQALLRREMYELGIVTRNLDGTDYRVVEPREAPGV
jgi:hypothetical protein